MIYNFDEIIERENTNSIKWNFNRENFGLEDVLPMWVADMDFAAPQPVIEALINRARHGIFGYSKGTDRYYQAIIEWMHKRHDWQVKREWITFCPGVVPALHWIVKAFAEPGTKVVVQTPVYHPFFRVIKNNYCEVIINPLKMGPEQYLMDLENLEQQLDNRVRLFFLCNPHNPVGRVWQKEELIELGKICLKNKIIIVADEVHSDLICQGYKHVPIAALSEELAQCTIVCTSPSKTFNMAGLQISNIIIPNPDLCRKFRDVLMLNQVGGPNTFAITAMESAYFEGEEWLEQLLVYLEGNLNWLSEFVKREIPDLKLVRPQGTYLGWLDFRCFRLEPLALKSFLLKRAKVALSDGYIFGQGGEGFARINIACPRSLIIEGMERIRNALKNI
ncbi:MAG: pyridoxal phosphate-dependent aminotransferase [Desulfitobacteriaceae bacterium]|nr:pyridoxal phosphate-dependent aminotransferase [Desulfitobacteriaceae bacterium]MDD4346684.1 pyridoxal phosphate-dependent aminotransferase [Desulfitobacteriaceae bacterium]MDD4401149.1 pyridoxal phosphate-dependent aminotransferase [Desulfitobacteriaceae bacterium]